MLDQILINSDKIVPVVLQCNLGYSRMEDLLQYFSMKMKNIAEGWKYQKDITRFLLDSNLLD